MQSVALLSNTSKELLSEGNANNVNYIITPPTNNSTQQTPRRNYQYHDDEILSLNSSVKNTKFIHPIPPSIPLNSNLSPRAPVNSSNQQFPTKPSSKGGSRPIVFRNSKGNGTTRAFQYFQPPPPAISHSISTTSYQNNPLNTNFSSQITTNAINNNSLVKPPTKKTSSASSLKHSNKPVIKPFSNKFGIIGVKESPNPMYVPLNTESKKKLSSNQTNTNCNVIVQDNEIVLLDYNLNNPNTLIPSKKPIPNVFSSSSSSEGGVNTTASNVISGARRYNVFGDGQNPPNPQLTLNLSSAKNTNVEFEGFGSGIPDSIKSARNKVQTISVAMPLSARVVVGQSNTNNTNLSNSSENKQFKTARANSKASIESGSSSIKTPTTVNTRFHEPITPALAIKKYGEFLTDYEQSEIFDYQKVYCIGNTNKKIRGVVNNEQLNYGYDDERGDYKLVLHDHIAFRYEVVGFLGKGSFGQVVKVLDIKENKYLALKVIRNRKRFHTQALIEVKILKHLKDHDIDGRHHIIEMNSYFSFRHHLCITFELLSINLYEFIKNNNFRGLSLSLIRRFALQILNSLKYLSREKIIHCDVKPENILLVSPNRSDIKLIDFGSSCFENEIVYTYIQSRFYRSPEIILGISYCKQIDMWSFGCILAELYTGYPLFPGRNELEQLNYIMEIFGVPSKKILQLSTRRKKFFDSRGNPRLVLNKKTNRNRIPGSITLQQALDCPDKKFISFLEGCLRWDPAERFTPEEAFRHEWILEALAPMKPQQVFEDSFDEGNESDSSISSSLDKYYKNHLYKGLQESNILPPIAPHE
ncbi:hypothetical protein ABK040_011882 [Willaertia magna]